MSFSVDISRKLGEVHIVSAFEAGDGVIALFGPSGSGKTSILKMIAGLLKPDSGRIEVGGTALFDSQAGIDLPPEQRRIGYVFQDQRLFPHKRVRDNLLYGYKRASTVDRWMQLDQAVAFLDIAPLLDRWPANLSGGEAQRVAIGRALLSNPRILLMDEPLSSLDKTRGEEIMTVIERIRDIMKLPILYVSHDRTELDRIADRVIPVTR